MGGICAKAFKRVRNVQLLLRGSDIFEKARVTCLITCFRILELDGEKNAKHSILPSRAYFNYNVRSISAISAKWIRYVG